MTFPVNIRAGWIQVTISPQKKFDNPETFDEIINPEELSSCWTTLKHIVDRIVEEQIDRSKSAVLKNTKTRSIVDIYNSLVIRKEVDENVLLKEVLKTGKFSEDEAKSIIKRSKKKKLRVEWHGTEKNMSQESRCCDVQICRNTRGR